MKRVLITGASGYLGHYLVSEAKKKGYKVRVLLRKQISDFETEPDEVFMGKATDPESLKDLCKGIDIVISTLGITRQKDGMTYRNVDYQANKNILDSAIESGVPQFCYVSLLNGTQLRRSKLVDAKESFVDYLKSTNIKYSVIRPSGFFSDMKDFQSMAQKKKIYLFGDGSLKINPIDGSDLSIEIIKSLEKDIKELNIGGPETYTLNQIGELAFNSLNIEGKIVHIPDVFRKMALRILPLLTPLSFYGPIEFFLSSMSDDGNTDKYGVKKLDDFFKAQYHKKEI